MRKRMADRNDETGVRKDLRQILDPDEIVIALRQVTVPFPRQQDFADVVFKEGLELVEPPLTCEPMQGVGRMQVGKEELPERLFERLRALRRDANAVLMRPFHCRLFNAGPIEKLVPNPGGHQKREIAVPMRSDQPDLGQLFQQDRRA